MPTNADLAARLLRDAAQFYRSIADQNPPIAPKMIASAETFEMVADRVEHDPTAEVPASAEG